jgi:hypothetical protein
VDRRYLKVERRGRTRLKAASAAPPKFSRVEIAAPPAGRPFAEVETAAGLKVRFFAPSAEAFEILSLLCVVGAAR